jgi:ABC-2 type transport system ATP-binding protein
MITLKNFTLKFLNKILFRNLYLKIESSCIFGIFGSNAIGKTSFFRALYGLVEYEGEITFENKAISKSDIGYLETESYFYPKITGKEYLNIFNQSENDIIFNIDLLAEKLGLHLNELIDNYSTGMKKKVSFLGIIKLNRNVLLLDEPFNGVDVESVYIMKNIINRLTEYGRTILITSHNKEDLLDLCNYYLVLENSNKCYLQNKDEILIYFDELKNKANCIIDSSIVI